MIIDISWPIFQGMTEYKDRASVRIAPIKTIHEQGAHETMLTFHSHTGTHIDAPAHFIEGGKTVNQFSLDTFVGLCKVIDLSCVQEKITVRDLEQHAFSKGDRVLLKTRNSSRPVDDVFDYNFVYLESMAAEFLASKSVQLVGIDYVGIERNQPAHETHLILLRHDIPILEGLRLHHVSTGEYRLFCLPLAIPDIDAVPARALLQTI